MPRMHRYLAAWIWFVCATLPAHAGVQVVASTIFPVADLARSVLDESTQVVALLPAGANPHSYEPTPQQMRDIERADLLIEVGGGLDDWTRKLRGVRSRPLPVLTLTAVTPLLPPAGSHPHAPGDPHVWLDPIRMRDHFLPALVRIASELDPEGAQRYAARQALARERLTRLDAELATQLAPVRGRSYVALHSAWGYFAARYGLVEAATLEPFPGKELSARELVTVLESVRTTQARALLVEPGLFARTAAQLARETGLKLVTVDPFGGPGIPGYDNYDALLRSNAALLVEALQ